MTQKSNDKLTQEEITSIKSEIKELLMFKFKLGIEIQSLKLKLNKHKLLKLMDAAEEDAEDQESGIDIEDLSDTFGLKHD